MIMPNLKQCIRRAAEDKQWRVSGIDGGLADTLLQVMMQRRHKGRRQASVDE